MKRVKRFVPAISIPRRSLPAWTDLHGCCLGAVHRGRAGCTCWRPVYDVEQADAVGDAAPATRGKMCEDCACRSDSPESREERGEDMGMRSSVAGLLQLVAEGRPFYCHQGMRRAVADQHPNGLKRSRLAGDYAPGEHAGIPLKADGSPADICAGWAAMRQKLIAREREL